MDNIAIERISLCVVVMIIIGLIIYQYFSLQYQIHALKQQQIAVSAQQSITDSPTVHETIIEVPQTQISTNDILIRPNTGREYDYRTLYDQLYPPYKRDDYVPWPSISTRGYPTAFKKIGLLIDSEAPNTDQYKFMILMGRQKYLGSNHYDYYITENKSDSVFKLDLPNLHKELLTDDTLPVTELDKTYTIKVDRIAGYEYSPFI